MRIPFRTLAHTAAISAAAAAMLAGPVTQAAPRATGEEKLSKLLEGREAGEPRNCIPSPSHDRMQVIDGTAIVYGRGDTIYVQRTRAPEHIDRDDILVVKRYGGSQMCRLDNVTTVDRFSGFYSGFLIYEDFVPYTRVRDDG